VSAAFDNQFTPRVPPVPIVTITSESPILIKGRTPPGIVGAAFDNQFVPRVPPVPLVPLVFTESPTSIRPPFQLKQWADYPFLPTVAEPLVWGMFSESPWTITKPRPLYSWVDYVPRSFVPLVPLSFSESPTRVTPPFQLKQWADFPFPVTVALPGWGMFSESPTRPKPVVPPVDHMPFGFFVAPVTLAPAAGGHEAAFFVKPRVPVEHPTFANVPVGVVNPAIWGMFSESQWAFVRPKPLYPWADYPFLPTIPVPAYWGMFSESPTRTTPAKALQQFVDFQVLPILVPTPSALSFSESPYALKKPTPLYSWSDISFLQIAITPASLVFSESPYAIKRPKPFEQQPFEFLAGIIPTPSALAFSESPFVFRGPYQLKQWNDVPWIVLVPTPASLVFSESPYTITKSRPEIMPWVGMPTLPITLVPLVFAESPIALKRPFQLKQFYDISFFQIAYTPSNWGMFSESPAVIAPRIHPLLTPAADISFLQIVYTPGPLTFSEQHVALKPVTPINLRDQPSTVPTVPSAVAATPAALAFSESPTHVTARWMGAAQLSQEGSWGWAFPPPVVVSKVFEWHIRYRRRGRR
jgi:hypothetical protein